MPASTSAPFDAERRELEAVLSSRLFGSSSTRGRLLRYICEQHFAGRTDQIREYNLATEVVGRSSDFDKKQDSVVRVEAHRLRKRLLEYYAGEGKDHPLQIQMSPGQYAVRFVPRAELQRSDSSETAGGRYGTILFRGGLLAGVVLIGAGIWVAARMTDARRSSDAPAVQRGTPTAPAAAGRTGEPIRILAGLTSASYVDRAGRTWGPDRYFTGGSILEVPLRTIYRGADPLLYVRARTGEFRYDIPVGPGTYELQLLFAETYFREDNVIQNGGEASRIFSVYANGKPLLLAFDILAGAGGPNIADSRVFRDVAPAPDGYLHLEFKGSALVNGIEISPGTPGRLQPIRICAARRTGYTDVLGRVWEPDQYSMGGRAVLRAARAKGEPDPELFGAERFGNFSYAIPVDSQGVYTARLMFVEHFWGPGGLSMYWPIHPGKVEGSPGGIGSRTFDLMCNTRLLLREFDIYKEAGGRLIGITKTFPDLRPNAQGKLVFSFLPVSCYATLSAIEILEQ